MQHRRFGGPRSFHKKKRLAKKLFKRWQAANLKEMEKVWGPGEVSKRKSTCERCDSITPPGTMFWYEDTGGWECHEWEQHCSVCAYDKAHDYDDFDHCLNESCYTAMDNPIRKKTGKLKYQSCPTCGGETMKTKALKDPLAGSSLKCSICQSENYNYVGCNDEAEAALGPYRCKDCGGRFAATVFTCDTCEKIFPIDIGRIETDMDGEEGDAWKLCPTCHGNFGRLTDSEHLHLPII